MKEHKHLTTIIIIAAIAFITIIQMGFNSYLFLSVKKDLAEIKQSISEKNPEKEDEKEAEEEEKKESEKKPENKEDSDDGLQLFF